MDYCKNCNYRCDISLCERNRINRNCIILDTWYVDFLTEKIQSLLKEQKKRKTKRGERGMKREMPLEQQKLIEKVKKEIETIIRMRKKIHLPKTKIKCEIYKLAIEQLLENACISDITYYKNLKETRKFFMETI